MLRYEMLNYESTPFAAVPHWLSGASAACVQGMPLSGIRVTSAPPGRHDLEMCSEYERQWRSVAADVLYALMENRRLLIWAEGRVEPGALIDVLWHVGLEEPAPTFHLAAVTKRSAGGFVESWLSFDPIGQLLARLFADNDIDFELARLHGLLVPRSALLSDHAVTALLTQRFWEIGFYSLPENTLAVGFDAHFEGCVFVGRPDALLELPRQLERAGLRLAGSP